MRYFSCRAVQKQKKMEWVIQQLEQERYTTVKKAKIIMPNQIYMHEHAHEHAHTRAHAHAACTHQLEQVRKQWQNKSKQFANFLADISGMHVHKKVFMITCMCAHYILHRRICKNDNNNKNDLILALTNI